MCGIIAIVGNISDETAKQCSTMLDVQKFRGPDNTGIKVFESCILGHNRLSIIDFSSTANQPMKDSSRDIWITFNGEIFNFIQLRRTLELVGHTFSTNSDTEVLLKMYVEYGINFVKRIEGQFAFVIFDREKNRVIAARDRMGILPLYYSSWKNKMYFSSMFKAIVKVVPFEIEKESLNEYLFLRYVLPPKTIAKKIFQLSPGEMMVIENGKKRKFKYWNIEITGKDQKFKIAKSKIKKLIKEAVEKRLVSDAPVGLFLSGGLDSTIICNVASKKVPKMNSFSIKFGNHSSEENKFSRAVSKYYGTVHQIISVEKRQVSSLLDEWIENIDHPNGARDMFAMYMLAKLVKSRNPEIKVVLTGTGADELFNGYSNAYFAPKDNKQVSSANLKKQITEYFMHYAFTGENQLEKLKKIAPDFNLDFLHKRVLEIEQTVGISQIDSFNLLNLFYSKVHLVGWELLVADNMGMQCSLELRPPILDTKVVNYAFSIPGEHKYKNGIEKYILREAFKEDLPEEIYLRKKGPFSKQVTDYMSDNFLSSEMNVYRTINKFVDIEKISELSVHDDADVLWRLYVLSKWIEKN